MDNLERKINQSMANLEQAITRLEEALSEDQSNSLIVDGTIQRFEFTIELYWKTLRRLLLSEGIETKTPKETLKPSYKAGWLQDEQAWLQMLKDRNETSHIYNEETANQILGNINSYFPEMLSTFKVLRKRYEDK
ncbi:HI0074 family nucleotidyltransferase substrate-binding subunit [Halobacillus hunanensis]|uniref:HI0074 family nucleotidyltransferase substrate-binding subunit n=1 Tax=Halobacillus hunanensis TaxID=578214 RepID=UPI001FE8147C|nr:HI0074 family nucleotidyltransferase substrate-binding subunit [Halobacillus hunanensis]